MEGFWIGATCVILTAWICYVFGKADGYGSGYDDGKRDAQLESLQKKKVK